MRQGTDLSLGAAQRQSKQNHCCTSFMQVLGAVFNLFDISQHKRQKEVSLGILQMIASC